MRIGFFLDIYDSYISGMAQSTKDLKQALEKAGHTVYIITTNSNNKIKKYLSEKNIIKIPSTKTKINNFNLRLTYPKKCEKIIENLNLDIIHSHTEFTIGRFGKKMAKKLNIPFIQTFHTLYDDSVNYITKGHLNKLTTLLITKLITSYYNDKIINEIIVPTKKIEKILINKYKIKNNINIIPSGIDIEKYKKQENDILKTKLNIKNDDFIVLWVGRIGYEKNIKFLIKSHIVLAEKNPHIKLFLVGEGPLEEELKQLVKQNHKEQNIIFLGKIKHNIINDYYHIGNIFSSASESETQGLTLLEALASSLPVLCIKNDVFKETIKNNYNGYLFKNEKEYIKKVLYLSQNKNKYNKLKTNTTKSVQNYSLEKFATNVLETYNKALKQKSTNTNKNNTK